MNAQCQKLLNRFCARHSMLQPEPDDVGHYHFGFDNVEVTLFEERGKLYLVADLIALPDIPEKRERFIEKSSAYLFPCLYVDECALSLYNIDSEERLTLVTVVSHPDENALEPFETQLSALVNRAESLIRHLDEPSQRTAEERFAVFRP